MSFFYEGCTTKEIRAYRELEGQTFDFGQGKMKTESSEDAYYEMCLPKERGEVKNYQIKKSKKKPKIRLNKYERKKINKKQLKKLRNEIWWGVYDNGEYLKRCYLSRRKKNAKRASNRKVRRYKGEISNGGHYRKFYDYWWEVF